MNFCAFIFSFVFFLYGSTAAWFVPPSGAAGFPKVMPADVKMTYYNHGGMTDSWERIEIFERSISFEVKEMDNQETKSWKSEITREESEVIYRTFVENRFDKIKNKKQGEIVYDAGSETLSIKAGDVDKSISYGPNSPLSLTNEERFNNIFQAVKKLAEKNRKD
ncbi:MAG: hypothetical protein R2681_11385 [Pyrinomonadaceae bacterium]